MYMATMQDIILKPIEKYFEMQLAIYQSVTMQTLTLVNIRIVIVDVPSPNMARNGCLF